VIITLSRLTQELSALTGSEENTSKPELCILCLLRDRLGYVTSPIVPKTKH
jgi:hypothetical protein